GLAKSFLKEGSDELYYDDENPCLPLGTISIEETKAPKGYLLKGYKLTVTDTATGKVTSVTDGKFVAKITKEYKGAKLQF
ncbi:SpaA isopeptide-forming pilin-related protein, partial [Acinetobacter baumannii]